MDNNPFFIQWIRVSEHTLSVLGRMKDNSLLSQERCEKGLKRPEDCFTFLLYRTFSYYRLLFDSIEDLDFLAI